MAIRVLLLSLCCLGPFSLRLEGGASRCQGEVQLQRPGLDWTPVATNRVLLKFGSRVCSALDCGSVLFADPTSVSSRTVVEFKGDCEETELINCFLNEAIQSFGSLMLKCLDLLNRPALSLSVTVGISQVQVSQVGVQVVRVQLGSQFLVQCSVKPQFPGGSFQLLSPSGNHTLPAVNHSAHFLFNHTGPAHKGDYTCVYHLQVFNHSFTSKSERLELRLGVLNSDLIIRLLVILLMTLLYIMPMYYCYYHKTKTRSGARETPENLILRNEVITDTIELH